MTTYEAHELADKYPLAEVKEFEVLKNSISTIGQQQPITIFEGKILDGRNRYKACYELGIEPIVKIYTGSYEDAFKYSIDMNSGRRHMNKSQKAMIAAFSVLESRAGDSKNISVATASQLFSVSDKYIKRAMAVSEANATIAKQVFEGAITIILAEKKIAQINAESEHVLQRQSSIENYVPKYGEDEKFSYQEIQDYIFDFSSMTREDLEREVSMHRREKMGTSSHFS